MEINKQIYWGGLFRIAAVEGKGQDGSRIGQDFSQLHRKLWGCMAIQNCPRIDNLSEVLVGERGWAFIHMCQPVFGWGLPWEGDMTLDEVNLFSRGNANSWGWTTDNLPCSWGNISFNSKGGSEQCITMSTVECLCDV